MASLLALRDRQTIGSSEKVAALTKVDLDSPSFSAQSGPDNLSAMRSSAVPASGSIFATALNGGFRAMPRRIERSGKNAS